jgi:hypothetical protein
MCDIKETQHLWYLKNRERIIEHQKTYRKDKINNDYKFRLSVVNYQARYYQNKKFKLKQKEFCIKQNTTQKIVDIGINDTTVIF